MNRTAEIKIPINKKDSGVKSQTILLDDLRNHLTRYVTLTDNEFHQVKSYFTARKAKKNQVLIQPGDRVVHTYWVGKGLITSTFTGPDGKEHVIQFANEGCWITDQNAFYNKTEAIFSITCLEESQLLCLGFEDREKLCQAIPAMERFFRKKGNDSFVKQQKRLLTYLTSDSRKRYELLLTEYPQLIQRLSKKTLAAYLGVSRETLSRFRK